MLSNKTKIRSSYTLTAQTLLRWIALLVFRLALSNFSLPIGGWSESTSENIEVPTCPLNHVKRWPEVPEYLLVTKTRMVGNHGTTELCE